MGPGPAGIPYIEYLFSRIVCTAVPIGYIILLVVLVIAGIKYIISGGEPKAVQSAHQTVTWGLLGVLFLAISWLILQLIQNFTGIEVTKFTVASLPGVEGFTGSCWSEPPKAPEPIKIINPIPNKTTAPIQTANVFVNGELMPAPLCEIQKDFSFLAALCKVECHSPYDQLKPINDSNFTTVVYDSQDINEIGKALSEPKTVNTHPESLDNQLWESTHFRAPGWRYGRQLYAKYPKNFVPHKLIQALYEAKEKAIDLLPISIKVQASEAELKSFENVYVYGFSCDENDFYMTSVWTPLIYLYPTETTKISVRINSRIISNLPFINSNWYVTATPESSLTTAINQSNFIPYEFLRKDFKRPTQGFVVDKEHYISFLKDNFWKRLELTDGEIADYWKDLEWRIPKSPYYFISLIDRSEVDRVLPMEVNPKPDTIIRNMTYILPLSSPYIPVPLPEIKAPQRNGFTVLENGGFIDGF